MNTSESAIDRIVEHALSLRADLVACAERVHPNNLAEDEKTTVQAALISARAAIDAFLARDDPDNEITGWASTE